MLSSILFNLYSENNSKNALYQVQKRKVYADDAVVFDNNVQDLQYTLSRIYRPSKELARVINTETTKLTDNIRKYTYKIHVYTLQWTR